MVKVLLPIRTRSEGNLREHWAARHRRRKEQRIATHLLLFRAGLRPAPRKSITVTLTRIAPRRLDTDNLAASMKAVQDGVADSLGVDDGDPGIQWVYAQRKGKPNDYAVEVTIA